MKIDDIIENIQDYMLIITPILTVLLAIGLLLMIFDMLTR